MSKRKSQKAEIIKISIERFPEILKVLIFVGNVEEKIRQVGEGFGFITSKSENKRMLARLSQELFIFNSFITISIFNDTFTNVDANDSKYIFDRVFKAIYKTYYQEVDRKWGQIAFELWKSELASKIEEYAISLDKDQIKRNTPKTSLLCETAKLFFVFLYDDPNVKISKKEAIIITNLFLSFQDFWTKILSSYELINNS